VLFLNGLTKTWYLTFDKMADECCALLIYKFVEPNQNLGQKARVRFGFVTLMVVVVVVVVVVYLYSASRSASNALIVP